jgi:hypothetical protein
MGILASRAPSANGDTAGETACAARPQPRDERGEEARRLQVAVRRGSQEQSGGRDIHAGRLLWGEDPE